MTDLQGSIEPEAGEAAVPDLPPAPPHEEPASDAPAEAPPDPSVSPWRRWRRWILQALLALVGIVCLWLAWEVLTWPDVARLRTENPATTAFIERYRERERAAGRREGVAWMWVPASAISPYLKKAVLAGEDVEFFSHRGFSAHEAREAMRRAAERRERLRGASTITQQLAKNLWLSPRRSLSRKAREAILTVQLERELSKGRILELYLNVAQFGPGIFGAEAAARLYFAKPAARLEPREAAMLAAGLPRPSTWNPGSSSQSYQRRTERLLELMDRLSFLDRHVGLGAPTDEPPGGEAHSAEPGEPEGGGSDMRTDATSSEAREQAPRIPPLEVDLSADSLSGPRPMP